MIPPPDIPILTIDGPGGAGKGTIALSVSRKLKWHYLDSGALYRVLGLLSERERISIDDAAEIANLVAVMDLRFVNGEVVLGGELIDHLIRTESAGNRASRLAALPLVRDALLSWQRRCAIAPGLVADGRDMGTVVFPFASCKIFLTASPEARAQRRFNQLRLKGFDVNICRLFKEITERDQRDADREVSPLKPADDAIMLDTTDLTIEQVVAGVLEKVKLAVA